MTDSPATPEKAAAPEAEDAKPRSFMVWTGKRHVFRVRAAEAYWMVATVKLLGDVPAIEHEVRIIDPDTGEAVGEPVMTDDQGVVRVEVPENKAYHIELADPDPEFEYPAPVLYPDEGEGILRCQFAQASGEPLALAEIQAKAGDDEMLLTTDEDGRIDSPAAIGAYELTYGEQVFHAYALKTEDADAVYYFVVDGAAEAEAGEEEPAGDDPSHSPEEHLERHDMDDELLHEEESA